MSTMPPPELAARIRSAVQAEPKPATMRLGTRLSVAMSLIVVVMIVVVLRMLRPDLGAIPTETFVTITGSVVLLAIAGVLGAILPGRRGLGPPVTILLLVAVAVPILYVIVTNASPMHPPGAVPFTGNFLDRAWRCFGIECLVALVGLGAFLFALRGAVPVAPAARGAALGAGAASWAGLAGHIHCPWFDHGHLVLAHALPIVLFAVLGALVAPRIIKP
jgi:hypothetical protein